jgi:hypothetical protein
MTRAAIAPTLLAVMVVLAACNTTDALTPLADIGDSSGAAPSSPVTQPEAERLAGAPKQVFAGNPQQGGYHPAYAQTGYQSQQTYRPGTGAPPTTMQDQADALSRNGSSPAASAPIEGQSLPPPASDEQPPAQAAQPAEVQQPQQTAALTPDSSSVPRQYRALPADHRRAGAGSDATLAPAWH